MKVEIISNKINNDSKIDIAGYKHSFILDVCAALACNIHIKIDNVPKIQEKKVFCKIFDLLSKKYRSSKNQLTLYPSKILNVDVPNVLSMQVHGTIYLLPILLQLRKSIKIFESGGCRIGNSNNKSTRPLQHILDVMKKFGAFQQGDKMFLTEYQGTVIDVLPYSTNSKELCGPLVSGVTKTAILCSLSATSSTTIIHPYLKTDVLELLQLIHKMGYKITKTQNSIIIEKGKSNVDYISHRVSSDVTEVITFVSFAVYYNVRLTLNCWDLEFLKLALKPEFELLDEMGVFLEFSETSLTVFQNDRLKAMDILVTGERIYSDSQPFFALMLLKANGISKITDNVWDNRMEYAKELKKAGLNFCINGNTLIIRPSATVSNLPVELEAKDLRGAAVLILYALQCCGSIVSGCEHLKRGYESFWEKLRILGIEVKIIE